MSSSRPLRVVAAALAVVTLAGTAGDAFAARRYHPAPRYSHRGYGAGPAVAGAALGIIGAAAAGIAANRYYNGYPAYGYGQRYGDPYGYDYHPSYGYYGPY